MKLSVLISMCVLCFGLNAQKYPVSEIPTSVRKGANVVIRNSEQVYQLLDPSNATYAEKQVITIFNEDGFDFAIFQENYDKLSKIKSIKVNYFDKEGKLLKKVRSSEIEDVKMTGSGSLYDDNRLKGYIPKEFDYPFTIEYSFVKDIKAILNIRSFFPQFTDKLGVEKASYHVIVPGGYNLRYKPLNGIKEPEIAKGSKDSYKWSVNNLEPVKREFRGTSIGEKTPGVMIAPSNFSMEGYDGNMTTWSNFGEWIAKLNKGRDVITDEVKVKVDELLEGATTDREKARRIYKFMQENTRYVSIQLGIGGFQPFDAINVISNGYGDCKALSNYTYSLLKYAGVKSNYVVIRGGSNEREIEVDFPSSQFNHVILAVPMEKDTVWLECTSQIAPFNFLGNFTDNRYGMLVTEDGKGALVKTPEYSAEESTQNRTIDLTLDKEGNAKASVKTTSKGVQYALGYRVVRESSEEQRKRLLNTIDIPAFDLGTFKYEEDRTTEDPFFTEEIELNIRKFATKSGQRLFITPNLLNKYNGKPPKIEERETPIFLRYNFIDSDTVNIKIPEGYRMEFQMEPYEITSDFGEYKLSYDFNPETNQLTYIRRFRLNAGEYAPETYNKYRSFIRKVVKQDKSKLVLIGST